MLHSIILEIMETTMATGIVSLVIILTVVFLIISQWKEQTLDLPLIIVGVISGILLSLVVLFRRKLKKDGKSKKKCITFQ